MADGPCRTTRAKTSNGSTPSDPGRSTRMLNGGCDQESGCSVAGTGLADSASRSSALRCARSSLRLSRRPLARRRSSSFFGRRLLPRRRRLGDRLEHLLLGRLERLGLGHGGQHGLAPQRLLGVRLGLLDRLLLGAAGDAQVGLAVDALVGERVQHRVPQLARPRLDQRVRHLDRRRRDRGVQRRLAELALDPRRSRPRPSASGCRRAARRACRSRPPRRARRRASGSCLALTSRTVTANSASWPASSVGAVVVREGDR